MANRLTALKVQRAAPGKYSDGGNLYLVVSESGARKWICRYSQNGKAREMGLGSAHAIPLAEARQRAQDAMRMVYRGEDPIAARKKQAAVPTFGELAEEVCSSLELGFKNAKHRAQWRTTLAKYAASLTSISVNAICTEDVLRVLRPIWTVKVETASRVRGRIEKVLDAAKAKGFRTGENPARWRGHLDNLLPKQPKLVRGHHLALPYPQVAPLLARVRVLPGTAARALEFCILTASRTGEVLGATWDEIDFEAKTWAIPKHRMKAARPHTVPLSEDAVQILSQLPKGSATSLIFPGSKAGKPLSNMAMAAVLRRLEVGATVHGFRSSFRDWAGNETEFPRDLIETALAHVIGDKAEQAYRRSDALERRRRLMDAWAYYCLAPKD